MRFKGANGEEHNVTSQGQGNLNTVLGAVGAYGALNQGGGLLNGLFGGNCNNGWNRSGGCSWQDMPMTRYEASMLQELGAKDSKIALLESNIYTDSKIADVYERLNVKINANKDAQEAVNLQQAVCNGTANATMASLQNQITALQGLSELVVPQRKVCDTCCGCNQ